MRERLAGRRLFLAAILLAAIFSSLSPGCSGSTTGDGGVQCVRDEECGLGEICVNQRCVPFGSDEGPRFCSTDTQCRADEICEDGVCVKGSRPDGGDGSDASDSTDGGGDVVSDGGSDASDGTPVPNVVLTGDVVITQDAQGKTYAIDFGTVTVGQPVSRNLLIRNTGDADLSVSVITLDQDPDAEFETSRTVPPALVIGPGAQENIAITYSARDGLTDHAIAKVFSNDPDEPEIRVSLNSEFKGVPALVIEPMLLDFGDVSVGERPQKSVALSNQGSGNAVLKILSVAPEAPIASAYQVSLVRLSDAEPVTAPLYINRGDGIEARVTFAPPSRNAYNGDLVITTDLAGSEVSTVALRGRAGAPAIRVEPAQVDFGQVPTNTVPPQRTVEISNAGKGDLTITSLDLLAGHTGEIFLVGPPSLPLTIAPGALQTVSVGYAPVDVGIDQTSLVIIHDDPDRQPDIRVPIGGEGVQGNARPTAVIKGNGQNVALLRVMLGEQVNLDASASFDTDGTIAGYAWRIVQQPSSHPCGSESTLSGATGQNATIVLREAGITRIGLKVKDDLDAWSDEDMLDIQVSAAPVARIRVGGNDTGFVECDLANVLTFNGQFSSDCDGQVTEYEWSVLAYPAGRGVAPAIQGGGDFASILFDFPGNYRIGLVVKDNDVPKNSSPQAIFDVLVRGPKAFRVTADWFNQGQNDNRVDVDIHLLKPGSSGTFTAGDCYPGKPGVDSGNPTPNWGALGTPVYQRDGWEDADGVANPTSPADEINFANPGMGVFTIKVYFRCHSSTSWLGDYQCCDDLCGSSLNCPFCGWCMMTENFCNRVAIGEVSVYVTGYDNVERKIVTRGFSFPREQGRTFIQIGTLSWPDGNFQ